MFNSKNLYYFVKSCVEKMVLHPETFQFIVFIAVEAGLIYSEDFSETILYLKSPLSEADLTRMSIRNLEIEDLWIVCGKDMRDHYESP